MKKKSHLLRNILIGLLIVIAVIGVSFYIYVSDYYHASDYVTSMVESYEDRVEPNGNLTIVYPRRGKDTGDALIFYPGGLVEADAYLPLLLKLSDEGLTCVLVEMPFNLAVFGINEANKVFEELPTIDRWYLAGHSLGGAMASSYIEKNVEKFEGLILLGAYPINDAAIETLAIYGTHDIKLDIEKVNEADIVFEIIDGNHAQFGDYGIQEGDGEATISREEQQLQTVEEIMKFIK